MNLENLGATDCIANLAEYCKASGKSIRVCRGKLKGFVNAAS